MNEVSISEDYCKCGHLASAHSDGDGECHTCRVDGRMNWALLARCHRFTWAERWEPERRTA